MKKLSILLLAFISLIACKPKENKPTTPVSNESSYQLDPSSTIVNWVGYKFTEKKGVKGVFKTINITNNNKANTLEEALKNVEVSIPVSSIFSGNDTRDHKLKDLFFGMMENTALINAKVISVTGDNGVMSLTLNNETHDLPFTIQKQGNTAYLSATLDINVWNAQKAFNTIHKACELLHTGADGVSKTWETFDIDITANFIKE